MNVEVTFTPAEFQILHHRDLSNCVCVVFDVLRATSTIVTALARGAASILPVASIAEALTCRATDPSVLLAGERDGVRISAAVSGGVDFDLANSPREYTAERIRGRHIVTTTTNGTHALTACRGARHVFAASLLNLKRTAEQVARSNCDEVTLVCSGTGEHVAFEDCLGAGALCHQLLQLGRGARFADSAHFAADLFAAHADDLEASLEKSSNAQRLLAIPELRQDVSFCLTVNLYPIVAASDSSGRLYRADINP